MKTLTTHQVVIDNGASLSAATQDLSGYRIIAIIMPAAWTAAGLTFQAAPATDGTFLEVVGDDGVAIGVTAAASQHIALTGAEFDALNSCPVIKVRSGTSGAAVNQGAARTITLVLEPR